MIKRNSILLASLMLSTSVMAEIVKKEVKVSKLDDGKLHGYTRLHHIFDGESNGFDKNTGSTVGVALKYGETFSKHFALGGEVYGVAETGFNNHDKTVALGQGMGVSSTDQAQGHVSGLHFTLKGLPGKSKVTWARSQFKSPMTKIEITHVPNMYEYLRADTGILGGNLSLSFITDMAYGSRSAADWGLIGERTATAGMSHSPFSDKGTNTLERGKYYRIDETAGSASTEGIAVVGYERQFDNLKLNIWNFKAENILNNLYTELDYAIKFGEGNAVVLSGQYLKQKIDDVTLNSGGNTYGGAFYGAQAKVKVKKFVLKIAYNKKDDEGGFYNAWGANPGYTSSIFSRNEYRDGVKAGKITGIYGLTKNLKVMGSVAQYSQSNMKLAGKDAQGSAKETDLVMIYKPQKNLMLKLFNANRTSEFNGLGATPKTQNHTRLIANYAF
ncbi:MAG: Unknown protein [uncultured Sulfurovum sp.]|uniref:Outer membrane porin, OprD family n=1 Tax=uncultured Sulfurovum sp. TaxID=269237 RepID=A0A6S6TQM1_9BACT|nr:MAG: Unknown protein [uncultured Sulfurovum sp.]